MKKVFITLLIFVIFAAISYGQSTYGTMQSYINTNIKTNGTRSITGAMMNNIMNQVIISMGVREYDATRTYKADSSAVLYDGDLFICRTAITVPEAWTAGHWQQVTDSVLIWSITGTDVYPASTGYDVGIGMTNPSYKLDVTGDIRVQSGGIRMGSGSAASGWMGFENNKGLYGTTTGLSTVEILKLNTSNVLELRGGGVKVGTTYLSVGTTPATADDIRLANRGSITARDVGDAANVQLLYLSNTDIVNIAASKLLIDPTTAQARFMGSITTIGDSLIVTDASTNDSLIIYDDGDTSRIESDNPIKIGSSSLVVASDSIYITTPLTISDNTTFSDTVFLLNGANLSNADADTLEVIETVTKITGKLVCDSIYTVKAAVWADYVFSEDYNLKTLSDELTYIKTNKHLRSLNPADSNKQISVADMQRRIEGLVEEVEKLYLYIEILENKINTFEK